jgi:hypothetical protein
MSVRLNALSRKKVVRLAVVSIGINYAQSDIALHGCINDSNNMLAFLRARCSANLQSVTQLTENQATRVNIEGALQQLVDNQTKYTHILVHYSGHGGQIVDKNNDEVDGLDECLVPVDYATAGFISDDWLLSRFAARIKAPIKLFLVMDACHSATVFDLKYSWTLTRSGQAMYATPNRKCVLPANVGNVVLLSGCTDASFSYDTYDKTYGASGAMTSALLHALNRAPKITLSNLVWQIRSVLAPLQQVPQVTSTKQSVTPFFADFL